MNQFLNPAFLLRVAQSYLSDVNRLWHITSEKLERYQNSMLRNMVKQAFMAPVYREKYIAANIRPYDVQTLADLSKLPLISKDDLRRHYPLGIITPTYNVDQGFLIHTSGSTGQPVFIYTDLFSAIKSLGGFVRTLRAYSGNWRSSRIAMIIDTSLGSVEHMIFTSSAIPFLHRFLKLSNILYIDITKPPKEVMMLLERFKPEFIGSDPNMLRKLAFLRCHGKGGSLEPKYIFSSGAMLDTYTKEYIHHAFNTPIRDVYGTTEAGPLAFQCPSHEHYHVHSDFVYLEFLDSENQPVTSETPGRLVVTKLYGNGTPIIRYTGINDLVTPYLTSSRCSLHSQLIKCIEGRTTDLLSLPDGSLLSPLTITGIPAKTMHDYHTYKIKQFQIIQRTHELIEVLIVIDDELRNTGISVEKLLLELRNRFTQAIGQNVKIIVTEVHQIQHNKPADTVKVVISEVPQKQ
ncbi:MAG: AMP-binding protein [Candidatus Thermoplasmatota archaeon]|nr:AMP-binding protein [Candidatus Thermoplasmatota archaeon]MBU1940696.1 AMP-binding protein [Candidatus Thermoplasmatota archaeon]